MGRLADFFVFFLDFLLDPLRAYRLRQIEVMDYEINKLEGEIDDLITHSIGYSSQTQYEDALVDARERRDRLLCQRNILAQKLGLAKI